MLRDQRFDRGSLDPVILLLAIGQFRKPFPPIHPGQHRASRGQVKRHFDTALLDLLGVPNVVSNNALVTKFNVTPRPFTPDNLSYMRNFSPMTTLGKFFGRRIDCLGQFGCRFEFEGQSVEGAGNGVGGRCQELPQDQCHEGALAGRKRV